MTYLIPTALWVLSQHCHTFAIYEWRYFQFLLFDHSVLLEKILSSLSLVFYQFLFSLWAWFYGANLLLKVLYLINLNKFGWVSFWFVFNRTVIYLEYQRLVYASPFIKFNTQHCCSPITVIVYTKYCINSYCDWRTQMPSIRIWQKFERNLKASHLTIFQTRDGLEGR